MKSPLTVFVQVVLLLLSVSSLLIASGTNPIPSVNSSQYADPGPDKTISLIQQKIARGVPLLEQEKLLFEQWQMQHENRMHTSPLDNQGGPDAFGYAFMDNQGADTATYTWIELRGDAQATWLNATDFSSVDDGMTNNLIDIGFAFPFYGQSYSQCRIGTNGDVQFTTNYAFEYTSCLPRANSGAMFAPLATDLHLQRGGISSGNAVVGYRNFGTYWVVEFDSIGFYNTSSCPNGSLKYEAILYNTGRIKFQYNHLVVPNGCYTTYAPNIGIQSTGTGPDLAYACGQSGIFPVESLAIWFFLPNGIPQPVTNFAGSANGTDVTLTWMDPTQDTNGNPLTPDSILIFRGSSDPGSQIGHAAHGVQTFAITNESQGNLTYYAKVKAGLWLSAAVSVGVVVGNPSYANNFDTNNGGWDEDGSGVWAWGAPTNPNGPTAHSGSNVWAAGLTGNYSDGVCGFLDLAPGLRVSSPAATLEFWFWYQIEQGWDGCNVKVSVDSGATWEIIHPLSGYSELTNGSWACTNQDSAWGGYNATPPWQYAIIPIGQFLNQIPIFRFTFGSDGSVNYAGFFFDDMTIWGLAPRQAVTGHVYHVGGSNPPLSGAWVIAGTDSVQTDASGSYTLSVEPGTYTVTFRHATHCDSVVTGVVVNAGENTTVNASLRAPLASMTVSSLTILVHRTLTQTDSFGVANSGACPLHFVVSDSVTWLNQSPMLGDVDPGDTTWVRVTAVPGIMQPGDYEANVRVTCNSAGSPFVIHVDMSVLTVTPLGGAVPMEFALHTNYPNPFNPSTVLPFDVAQQSRVDIIVYNVMGQEVARPVSGIYAAGRYQATFTGESLPSGLYFVKMTAGSFASMGKMMLLK